MVYLIVSPKNPLKDSISSNSGNDRYKAAIKASGRHFKDTEVYVDDIELGMPEPHYTIRTLDALREREPENSFTFILGADNLADIRRWREYDRILKEYGVAVYPRKNVKIDTIKTDLLSEDPSYKIAILEAPMVNISSTEIREGLGLGKDMSKWIM